MLGTIAPLAEKVNHVRDATLLGIPLQPAAMRPVTDNQDVHIVPHALDEIRRPDDILEPLLRPEPADGPNQPGIFGKA
jgi:hypothetical protein